MLLTDLPLDLTHAHSPRLHVDGSPRDVPRGYADQQNERGTSTQNQGTGGRSFPSRSNACHLLEQSHSWRRPCAYNHLMVCNRKWCNAASPRFWYNTMDDGSMEAFSSVVANGALGQLISLRLDHNRIPDRGMASFAVSRGALPKLKFLILRDNAIADEGIEGLSKCDRERGNGELPSPRLVYQ